MSQTDYVCADTLCSVPLGYLEYYDGKCIKVVESYCRKHACYKDEILKAVKSQNDIFAVQLAKSYPSMIPRHVIDMKIKHFIKEIVDDILLKHKPVQLELQFDEEPETND